MVQPGVEFGSSEVVEYDRSKARELSNLLNDYPQFIFEAHSTDYQPAEALHGLVDDGFAILKVGPALTFALRQALYGIDHIAQAMFRGGEQIPLPTVMERVMLEDPRHWRDYYSGDDCQQRILRHYSLSDRIRYYWVKPEVQDAVERLLSRFDGREIPRPLLSQYMEGVFAGFTANAQDSARGLGLDAIRNVLSKYHKACAPAGSH